MENNINFSEKFFKLKKLNKKSGMSLIEMMVAISIFTLGIAGFALLFREPGRRIHLFWKKGKHPLKHLLS